MLAERERVGQFDRPRARLSLAMHHLQRNKMQRESRMRTAIAGKSSSVVPKLPQKRHSYNESVDEPAKLIEDEPVEVEQEIPAEENEPLERIE